MNVNRKVAIVAGAGGGIGTALGRRLVESGAQVVLADVQRDKVRAIDDERFLVPPHPEVLTIWQRKSGDHDRWLAGVRRYQETLG